MLVLLVSLVVALCLLAIRLFVLFLLSVLPVFVLLGDDSGMEVVVLFCFYCVLLIVLLELRLFH